MRTEQLVLGSVFSAMGLGTMLFPRHVYELCFVKEFVEHASLSPSMRLVIQCFGSQATLCGFTILSTKWDSVAYRNFAFAMVPYLIFDGYFFYCGALTPLGALGDLFGNVVFLACCWKGYDRCRKEETGTKK